MKLGVDGMGGDFAPINIVEGVVKAAEKLSEDSFFIFGSENLIVRELEKCRALPNIEVVNSPEVVGMDEGVVSLLRENKRTSLHMGLEALARGDIDCFLSAGNTAAVVALSRKIIGTEEGIERGAILVTLPSLGKEFVLIDAGANVYAKPMDYRRNAIIGKTFSELVLGRKDPKIGLLNIGEEASKGHRILKEVHKSLKESPFSFYGNIESREIFFGKADVVLSDGFVGNVVLKLAEGVSEIFIKFLKEELSRKSTYKLGYILSRGAFRALRERMDYSKYGGGLLVGFKGEIIVAHGRSSGSAVENALVLSRKIPMVGFRKKWRQRVLEYDYWIKTGERRENVSSSDRDWRFSA